MQGDFSKEELIARLKAIGKQAKKPQKREASRESRSSIRASVRANHSTVVIVGSLNVNVRNGGDS